MHAGIAIDLANCSEISHNHFNYNTAGDIVNISYIYIYIYITSAIEVTREIT